MKNNLCLPLLLYTVLLSTRWKTVIGLVDYTVKITLFNGGSSGSASELSGLLVGTNASTSKVSFGSTWTAGSTVTKTITHADSIGYLKTIELTKAQSGTFNDDNLQITKVEVTSPVILGTATFTCPVPFCNIRWPNLITRLHTTVDGSWSEWSSWSCDCASSKNAVRTRTCTNPAPYYNGKTCTGAGNETFANGCTISCPVITTTTTSTTTPTTTTSTTPTTTSTTTTTENPYAALVEIGIPILGTLVGIALIVVIAMCIYTCWYSKKKKKKKKNQIEPHVGTTERGAGAKPVSGRPFVAKPIKRKPEEASGTKQYTLPVFGATADHRELFGDEGSADSKTSLLSKGEESGESPPRKASPPSTQGVEDNLYTEVAAPADEVKTVAGTPAIVGSTRYSSASPGSSVPRRTIHRMETEHIISLPGNNIVGSGCVLESEDIGELKRDQR